MGRGRREPYRATSAERCVVGVAILWHCLGLHEVSSVGRSIPSPARVKIGVIRQRYVAVGGAERYLDALVQALAAQGHTVEVFARAWKEAAVPGVQFQRVPAWSWPPFARAWTFAQGCRRRVLRSGCDLVLSLERTLLQDVYRAGDGCHREWLVQRSRDLPGWRRASIALNPLHRTLLALERRTYAPACTGRIIANSQRGREEIIRHYGFPPDRIEVVHNGVDLGRFPVRARPVLGENATLLFVGSGFRRKGLEQVVRALALLPAGTRLRVAGKGRPGRYLRLADALGVGGRVEFLGHGLDVAQVYPQGDVLVHPAIYEPFANVCLEALASGLPVVTSRINGASEVLTPGRDGAVVEDPRDVRALAEAIRPWLLPDRWAAASAAARATAEAHPFARNVEATLAVLMRAARERRPGELGAVSGRDARV